MYSDYIERHCPYTYIIEKIVKVVDGDTVDVLLNLGFDVYTIQRVRLLGIDCEECRTSDPIEKRFGKLAKRKLKHWCKKHSPENPMRICCEERDPRGKFGRVLAELWLDDININRWMVDNYFAVSYNGKSRDEIKWSHLRNREHVSMLEIV